jgi:hypothetical protein
MIEPVQLDNFFVTFLSAAMVVITGAVYALLFAWSRFYRKPRLMVLAYGAYAMLVTAVWVLADATNLQGFWRILVILLVLGYLLAPHGIWHLCVGIHTERLDEGQSTVNHKTARKSS